MRTIIVLFFFAAAWPNIAAQTLSGIAALEQDIADKNYSSAIKKAEQILKNNKTKGIEANEAATYLRFALLKQGTLNSEYLKYTQFIEMEEPLPDEIPEGENRAYILFCQELGFVAQTEALVSDIIKKYFVENKTPQDIPWQIIEQCYLSLEKPEYLQILKNSAQADTLNNSRLWADKIQEKMQATPPDTMLEYRSDLRDNVNFFSPIYRQNKELLEAYTLQVLIDKKLDKVPAIIERYNALGYKKLPKYIEEAADILNKKTPPLKKNSYTEYYFSK